jgi:multidrug efflux pump subunit AcrA (membrane-fusion protein)
MTTAQPIPNTIEGLTLDKGRPRRRRRGKARWLLIGLLVAAAGWFAKERIAIATNPPLQTSKASRVSPLAQFEIVTANGYVIPRRRASVASKTTGRLTAVLVDEGDDVQADQVLAEVEHREEDAAVAAAKASLENARAVEKSLRADLDAAKAAYETALATLAEKRATLDEAKAVQTERHASFLRAKDMRDQGITSDAQLDAVRMQLAVAEAQVAAAQSASATAEQHVRQEQSNVVASGARAAVQTTAIDAKAAALAQAEAARDSAFIRAPFGGRVLRREAEPGEVVSPANTGASGSKTAVVSLADFKTLEVEVDVYERDIAKIRGDTRCKLALDAYPQEALAGGVRLVRPTADRAKATVKVNVTFDKVPDFARPEMVAKVTFLTPGIDPLAPDRIEVPDAAIVTRDGRRGVLVLEESRQSFKPLELGASKAGKTIVTSGLSGGETLILPPP